MQVEQVWEMQGGGEGGGRIYHLTTKTKNSTSLQEK